MEITNPNERQFAQLFAGLVAVYDAAYREGPQQSYRSEFGTGQYLQWLFQGDPGGFFVVLEDGHPIGFASLHSGWHEGPGRIVGELHEVAVLPDRQGKGVGGALLGRADEYAREQGRDVIMLWVGENNTRAVELYRRLGFRTVAQRGVWIRMEKRLTSEG